MRRYGMADNLEADDKLEQFLRNIRTNHHNALQGSDDRWRMLLTMHVEYARPKTTLEALEEKAVAANEHLGICISILSNLGKHEAAW